MGCASSQPTAAATTLPSPVHLRGQTAADADINQKTEALMDALGLTGAARQNVMQLPREQKEKMIASAAVNQGVAAEAPATPSRVPVPSTRSTASSTASSRKTAPQYLQELQSGDPKGNLRLFTALRVELSSANREWMDTFFRERGIDTLAAAVLANMDDLSVLKLCVDCTLEAITELLATDGDINLVVGSNMIQALVQVSCHATYASLALDTSRCFEDGIPAYDSGIVLTDDDINAERVRYNVRSSCLKVLTVLVNLSEDALTQVIETLDEVEERALISYRLATLVASLSMHLRPEFMQLQTEFWQSKAMTMALIHQVVLRLLNLEERCSIRAELDQAGLHRTLMELTPVIQASVASFEPFRKALQSGERLPVLDALSALEKSINDYTDLKTRDEAEAKQVGVGINLASLEAVGDAIAKAASQANAFDMWNGILNQFLLFSVRALACPDPSAPWAKIHAACADITGVDVPDFAVISETLNAAATVDDLKGRLQHMSVELKDANAKIAALNHAHGETQRASLRVSELTAELERVKVELSNVTKSEAAAMDCMRASEATAAKAVAEAEELKNELSHLKGKLEQYEASQKRYEQELQELSRKLTEHPAQLQPATSATPLDASVVASGGVVIPAGPPRPGRPAITPQMLGARPPRDPTDTTASDGEQSGAATMPQAPTGDARPRGPPAAAGAVGGAVRPPRPGAPSPAALQGTPGPSEAVRPGRPPAASAAGNAVSAMLAGRPRGPAAATAPGPTQPAKPVKVPAQKPAVKVKGLFWTKLPDKVVDDTIFRDISDDQVKLDFSDLERRFAAVQAVVKTEVQSTPAAARRGPILLIPGKRQQNASIALARIRLKPAEVRDAILQCDFGCLPQDKLDLLKELVPTTEELQLVKEYEGPKEDLGAVEQFFLAVSSVPRLPQRIDAMSFVNKFEGLHSDLQKRMELLRAAVTAVRGSKSLPVLLKYVLAVGNFLNGDTARGGAYGFKIDTLKKLTTMQATTGKETLLDYIVQHACRQADGEAVFQLPTELAPVISARAESIDQVVNDVKGTETAFKQAASLHDELCKMTKLPGDTFDAALQVLLPKLKVQVAAIVDDSAALHNAYKDLLKWLSEDYTDTASWFPLLCDILSDVKKSLSLIKPAAQVSGEKGKPTQTNAASSGGQNKANVLDSLYGRIVEGKDSPSQSSSAGAPTGGHRRLLSSAHDNGLGPGTGGASRPLRRKPSQIPADSPLTPRKPGIPRPPVHMMTLKGPVPAHIK